MTAADGSEERPQETASSGPAADPPQPPRPAPRQRSLSWRIGTPVVVLLCGSLFVVSAVNSGGTDLRPGRYTDLPSLVEAEADEVTELQAQLRDLDDDVTDLTEDIDSFGVNRARGEIDELRDPAGLEPRSGEGISIEMSDSPDDRFLDALESGASDDVLRKYVVHQQDIQAVVNALWEGGARAVTIEGQRVVSTTGIKCEGNAVQLQGVPYPQPYEIEAVGDQDMLLAAIASDPLVAGYRADAADPQVDIGWELETEEHLEAPAYDGLLSMEHAEVLR